MTAPTNLRTAQRAGLALVGYFVRRHPISFAVGVGGAALFASAIVASAVVIGRATDSVILPVLDGGEPIAGRLWPAALAVVGVALWKAIGITLRRIGAGYLQYHSQADTRLALMDKVLRMELSWFRRQTTGDLLAITDADASQATFILAPIPYGTGASLLLIGTVVMVFAIDPTLALIVFVAIGGIVSIDASGSWRTFVAFQRIQEGRADVARVAHESFDGALTVKALGREDYETDRFAAVSDSLRDGLIGIGKTFTNYRVMVEALLSATTVVMLVMGAVRVGAGAISAGQVITIAYLLGLLLIPIRIIGFVLWDLSHSVAGWNRVTSVLHAEDIVAYGDLTARPIPLPAAVAGESIGFGYLANEPVLSDVNVAISPGKIVAIVGPTASGKSTLAVLMARLWDPDSGVIAIDGADVRDFARSALPGEVAFVSQEDFLFDDTVAGNIAFGVDVTDADIARAAQVAAAADFIGGLPDGYDTILGERGTVLSGGQRQRIALARALVRKPRLLILDDATSAVDPSVETRIIQALRGADLPSTVVVVAYRRSSIVLADEVIFVDDGRIQAQGRHQDLMRSVPRYAEILEAYETDAAERAKVLGETE